MTRRIHFSPALLARVEAAAEADRRTLANFVTAVVERCLDYWETNRPVPPPDSVKILMSKDGARGRTKAKEGDEE